MLHGEIHSALNHCLNNDSYPARCGDVLSNEREIKTVGKVTYIPIYFVIFIKPMPSQNEILI